MYGDGAGHALAGRGSFKPPREHIASPRQPARNGPLRPAEETRRLRIGLTFEVTKHHRRAVFVRQPPDGFVQLAAEFELFRRNLWSGRRPVHKGYFPDASAGGADPRLGGYAQGHAVKPVTEQFRTAERTGFANKDQERSLKSIFGLVSVSERPPTDAKHHAAVSPED